MIVDKRDYADLFSFCLTERFMINEITSYGVSDRFGSRRVALFAYHLVRCSKKLCGYGHPYPCGFIFYTYPHFCAISEILRVFIDQLEIALFINNCARTDVRLWQILCRFSALLFKNYTT